MTETVIGLGCQPERTAAETSKLEPRKEVIRFSSSHQFAIIRSTFPIAPRPGDRVYINLPAEYEAYFQNQIGEDRRICINGKVKFVELVDNSETMCVHVIDPYSE